MEKKELQKSPENNIYDVILLFLMVLAGIWLMISFTFFQTEQELYDRFADQELIGSANQRSSQMLQSTIVKTFGKPGVIIFIFICWLLIIYGFCKTLVGYIRYRKLGKNKD